MQAPDAEEEMAAGLADFLAVPPPLDMEWPGIICRYYTEQIEKATGQTAHLILHTVT